MLFIIKLLLKCGSHNAKVENNFAIGIYSSQWRNNLYYLKRYYNKTQLTFENSIVRIY